MDLIPITKPNSLAISGNHTHPSPDCPVTFHDRQPDRWPILNDPNLRFGQERGGQGGRNDVSKTTLCKLEAGELPLPATYGRLWDTPCFAPVSSSHGG